MNSQNHRVKSDFGKQVMLVKGDFGNYLVNRLPTHGQVSTQVISYLQQQGHTFTLGRCDQIVHHSESSRYYFLAAPGSMQDSQTRIKPMPPALGAQSLSQKDIETFDVMQQEITCEVLMSKMCNPNTPRLWP